MARQLDLFSSGADAVLEAKTYEEFRRRLAASDCTLCSLSEGRKNIVVDRGNPGAPILAVGEAPGADEDEQGLAFVGRAGQLLDQILEAVDLDTNRDLLIANIVKCRPPENRLPRAGEAEICLPFLRRQIELVRPKVILLLGATSLKYLLPDRRPQALKDEVGTFFTHPEHAEVRFMVLYHPAFLLRDPRKKREMWQHVQRLRDYVKELEPSRRPS